MQRFCFAFIWAVFTMFTADARSASVTDPNLFSKLPVVASSQYGISSGPESFVDGSSDGFFIFNDFAPVQLLNISGFDSDIDCLRFFDNPIGAPRLATGVIVYYSKTATKSLDPHDYESVANQGKPYRLKSENGDYFEPTSGPNGQDLGNTPDKLPVYYAQISNLNIPAGTKSVLLSFSNQNPTQPANAPQLGSSFTEIQGFSKAGHQ